MPQIMSPSYPNPECDVCGKVGISTPFGGKQRDQSPIGYFRSEDGSSKFILGHDEIIKNPNEVADSILKRYVT